MSPRGGVLAWTFAALVVAAASRAQDTVQSERGQRAISALPDAGLPTTPTTPKNLTPEDAEVVRNLTLLEHLDEVNELEMLRAL